MLAQLDLVEYVTEELEYVKAKGNLQVAPQIEVTICASRISNTSEVD